MNTSIPLICLTYILVLLFIFYSKKQKINLEIKYFLYLSFINIVGLVIEVISFTLVDVFNSKPVFLLALVHKFYYIYHFVWLATFSNYVFLIIKKKKNETDEKFIERNKKGRKFFLIHVYVVIFLIATMHYDYKDGLYPHEFSINTKIAFYIYASINIIYYLFMIHQTKEHRSNKKLQPLYLVLLFTIAMMIIQISFDYAIIITTAETFVCVMIYLSMENPDLIMLDKIENIKTISQKANEEKTLFLSNMSHEIRTPLNVIMGLSEEVKNKDLQPDELEKVNDIIISSNNLLELVNGILDISKIETGKLEIFESNYSFEKIFKELVTLIKIRIDDKSLKLKTSYDSKIPSILRGDKLRVKQVILNVLTNAVKYSEHGTIEFIVDCEIKENICLLKIIVKDQGKGVKKQDIPKLFTKFERLSEEGGQIEGTGLGLPISKKILELMKGKIDVESEINIGSTFTITLPQKIIELEKPLIELNNYNNDLKFPNKEILVVDDNDLNLKVAKRKLEAYDIKVDLVYSAMECLSKLKNKKYDLILMDDMMSEMTGTEAMKEIKEEGITKTPIVVLTANAIAGMRENYMSEGFDEYLSKPIDNEELKRVLIQFLK